jgi:hypothetical protein
MRAHLAYARAHRARHSNEDHMHRTLKVFLYVIGASAPLYAAQSPTVPGNPTDPTARVPAPAYQSVFSEYRKHGELELADWRAANDEVARIGGHIGIFRAGGFDGAEGRKPAAIAPGQPRPPAPHTHQH